ncbi:hypothetical protein OG735_26125 [Streptomyces sp. NBC_01210]|uniref:hypothetical protein n=1 Tax=Streptomyces sp. NBC_01210 TaxID=2903774 RepID=UPI002E114203|nr:hypothetical protein OG735_26125 [Streptomyces sp. NBC_01210]
MTVAAARSAAVLCALRRAAGEQRALQVVLFLGGLMTLGLLYGGQAHAADSAGMPESTVSAGTEVRVAPPTGPVPARELRRVATDSADVGTTDAADTVDSAKSAQPVQPGRPGEAAQPVQTVRHVVKQAADNVRDVVLPVAQPLTGPLTETLNGLLPVPLPPPGGDADQGLTPQLPVDRPVDDSADRFTVDNPADSADPGPWSGTTATTVGPVGGYDRALGFRQAEFRYERPVTAPAPAQVPGKPCDSTHGALQQSGETHAPRKGDQHAATSPYGTQFALVPGVAWAAAEAPTRERPRDILEFPG